MFHKPIIFVGHSGNLFAERHPVRRPRQGGFTPIELMVVLVIVGIATAAISLSARPDPTGLLRQDAARAWRGCWK